MCFFFAYVFWLLATLKGALSSDFHCWLDMNPVSLNVSPWALHGCHMTPVMLVVVACCLNSTGKLFFLLIKPYLAVRFRLIWKIQGQHVVWMYSLALSKGGNYWLLNYIWKDICVCRLVVWPGEFRYSVTLRIWLWITKYLGKQRHFFDLISFTSNCAMSDETLVPVVA